MQSDTVKLLASVLTAVVMAIGGSLLLVFVFMQPSIEGRDGLVALLGGFIGAAVQFLYGTNAQTQGVRTFQAGLNTPTPPQ